MQILVAGHLCLDIIPKWPVGSLESLQPGRIVQMGGVAFSTGGAVSNTGIALKRLGFTPILVGRIGNDYFGQIIRQMYKEEGIDDRYLAVFEGAGTSYSIVLSPPDSDRAFLHYPGANDSFSPEDVDFTAAPGGIFHFGYPPLMAKMYQDCGRALVELFSKAKASKMLTSLDMAMPDPNSPAGKAPWRDIISRLMPLVDIFLPSIDELLVMLGKDASGFTLELVQEAAAEILDMGAHTVGIKLGDQGFYLRTSSKAGDVFGSSWAERELLAPSFLVKTQGTTGAGDTTIAGFLAGVALQKSPEETLTWAVAVGAHCVEGLSAIGAIPNLHQVEERIRRGWPQRPVSLDINGWTKTGGLFSSPFDRRG